MRNLITTLAVASVASAFPSMMQDAKSGSAIMEELQRRALSFPTAEDNREMRRAAAVAEESNCGPIPCVTFDEKEQFVDVRPGTKHQYVAPGPNDLRGPCPGLNAAANHNFIPHNGILNVLQTTDGLAEAFGMSADFGAILGLIGVIFDGDPIGMTWSIGGPYQGALGLLGKPQGISFSHNKYEGDASATRPDAYLNNGDASSLVMSKFEHLYSLGGAEDRYTLKTLRTQFKYAQDMSIATNPHYFSNPFAGLLVVPAAHDFIINFMSNHTAEEPSGYLDGYNLKKFFAVTGEPGNFKWHPGQEQIPENWYRRPSDNQYSTAIAISDVLAAFVQDPTLVKLGGNTGTVNSFTGVDVGDLTGGVFNGETLLAGNNFGCFVFRAMQEVAPDALLGILGDAGGVLGMLQNMLAPVLDSLACPELDQYNQGLFNKFPGNTGNGSGAKKL